MWWRLQNFVGRKNKAERKKLYLYLKSKEIESRPIVAGNFAKQPVIRMLNVEIEGKLQMSDEINDKGLFFGNDQRDLSKQIHYLFENLDHYFNN